MQDEHTITAVEPVWQIQEFVEGENIPEPIGSPVSDSMVSGMEDYAEYECSCGREFETWREAEDHLQNRGEEE